MRARYLTGVAVIGGLALSGCATKGWVTEQLTPTRDRMARVDERVEGQEARLSETTGQLTQTREQVKTIDGRLVVVGNTASEAQTTARGAQTAAQDARRLAEEAGMSAKAVDERLNQRWANRNRYTLVETRSVYFDFDRAELKDDGITLLLDVAKFLEADPNAIVELQGFTDPLGSDRYNQRLARERVDAVVRYLVQKHGIDLRRIHAAGIGKASPEDKGKAALAKSRRVDIRLLAPPA